MNILFLTLAEISDFSQTGIYPDLINEFADHGHNIYVVSPCEKKNSEGFELIKERNNLHLISALIPDYFNVGFIKKGISSVLIGKRYIHAINIAIPKVRFQLVLYSTPPITFCRVIEKIKKRDQALTYLLLKDIWPQGPIDIGALSTSGLKGIITKYFKRKEKRLYRISDYIGCMSENNRKYLLANSEVDESKIEICPNSIKIRDMIRVEKKRVRVDYGLPTDKTIFVYGGNLGIAQGIEFLISCLEENERNTNTYILIIGSGTEYNKLSDWFKTNSPHNSKLIPYLPKKEYMEVMAACDVGLIFLDYRFTIPNFPSRLLSYMEGRMPVIAATDKSTDVGDVIVKGEFGYWCESRNAGEFNKIIKNVGDEKQIADMGENAYRYLENNYTVDRAYSIIMAHIK